MSSRDAALEEAWESQQLNTHDKNALEGGITMEELQRAIKEIGTGKSAGPDALPAANFTRVLKNW